MIALYHCKLARGPRDEKKKLSTMTLEDDIDSTIDESNKAMFAPQMYWLTGKRELSQARDVIESQYLMCATSEQVNKTQNALARLHGCPGQKSLHRNVSGSASKSADQREALVERHESLFKKESDSLNQVRARFQRVYANMTPVDVAAIPDGSGRSNEAGKSEAGRDQGRGDFCLREEGRGYPLPISHPRYCA